MHIPAATYRLQFTPNFGATSAREIIPYLYDLGISDIYASPIFKAKKGSTHGYDVVDWNQLNPELGTRSEFQALWETVQRYDMGWLQDIVPNHMAYSSENRYLVDVLERGSDSDYFNVFDIDWNHPYEYINGKVLIPLLGDFYGNCLERGEIQLKYEKTGLSVNYYELKLPLRIESYGKFITHDLSQLAKSLGRNSTDYIKLMGVLYILKNIPSEESSSQRNEQASFVKGILWELYQSNAKVKEFIDRNLETFNGKPGEPESFNLLDSLLDDQLFRLTFWKVGTEELNYRRFFTINELICLRLEEVDVFNRTHELIVKMVEAGTFTGLRIDHIDGLYNPTEYLQRLRDRLGDVYLVVEKILELGRELISRDEELPYDWPIQGTSGYEFLNIINQLFCQRENHQKFNTIYSYFTGSNDSYDALVLQKKRLILDTNLAGDLENLSNLFKRLSGKSRQGRDFTLNGIRKAIQEVLVLFPVYRTYTNSEGIRERDREYIRETILKAKVNVPQLLNELSLIEKILLADYDEWLAEDEKAQWLHFTMRLQQVSGSLMAKGIEDTLFYVYNRFISLNEVGGVPAQFGMTISAFHNFNQKQQDLWPYSLNASSTHDTKRSEDVRSRLNVLSEIPDEWELQVRHWSELNQPYKQFTNTRTIPDPNDEYFLYQTLIGIFPFEGYRGKDYSVFVERMKHYVIKAVREAKVHTEWLKPDAEYEGGYVDFVERILQMPDDNTANTFLEKFFHFQQRIAYYGIFNSLSQTLLKMVSPGVPDFYQGTELWDFSLVDPDNRRSVDFEWRIEALQEIRRRAQVDILGLIEELLSAPTDGRIKLFAIAQALATRRKYLDVFQQGAYVPIEVVGQHQDRAIAFARQYGRTTAIAVVPRFLTQLVQPGVYPLGLEVWEDTRLEMPQSAQFSWRNAMTDQTLPIADTLTLGQILEHFPVALLIGQNRAA
jgi:(1->4)-alpha-D-glucan 1-alpha-D-glucosylmutase